MSDAENYERGYHGHARGVVVANDGHGNFIVRQMTPAELAARAPVSAIGGEPYDFMSQAIDAALAAQAEAYDRRVTELLEANTREVERRREAEALALKYQATAAEQGSMIFRMGLALKLACRWGLDSSAYSSTVCIQLREWIAAKKFGPLPWPDQPFVEKWLRDCGYERTTDGSIGMIFTADLVPVDRQGGSPHG